MSASPGEVGDLAVAGWRAVIEGFTCAMIAGGGTNFRVCRGGSGEPVLLLHGHPRTLTTWDRVAPLLARHHSVVCPDLPGFGRSSKPVDAPRHENSSKRAKAAACVALMAALGHARFAVVGHDRGAYTAFRMAMDHPEVVTKLAVLDAVPILEALERCNARFAAAWWHWFFFAQPEKPERAILADPDAWYALSAERMGAANHADCRAAVHDPATVHGMLEDYRAGLGIDADHDRADRAAGRQVACPTLLLWSGRDDLAALYGDVLAVWRPWAPRLTGNAIDSGHHMAEEAPAALAAALLAFLARPLPLDAGVTY